MLRIQALLVVPCLGLLFALSGPPAGAQAAELYRKPQGEATRWSSFENPSGRKGAGGMENKGAKGHPYDSLDPGESRTLTDVKGSGMITRVWVTVNDRTTETLRALRLDMYWDGAKRPAVSVPFGDFFGALLGKPVAFESELFSNPEGKSFNCYIPMPFRKSARVVVTNESARKLRLLFYDVDYLTGVRHGADMLYFHASWRRENPTELGRDFELLPRVTGSGRFLGANIGVQCDRRNPGWWGEGEVKMFVDGDREFPTIVGTGTEDYIGTGWGQGKFAHRFQGCLVSDEPNGMFTFYRYHVPDPVYFDRDIRVTLQQMGGDAKTSVTKALADGVDIQPVTTGWRDGEGNDHFVRLLEPDPPIDVRKHESPEKAWTNYYRRDDVSAVALFYLDRPENGLPPLAPVAERIAGLK
jgi:hypothetical protein